MPSQAKKIQYYPRARPRCSWPTRSRTTWPEFYSPTVPLKSGGYLVINQTEPGGGRRQTPGGRPRERNIEATAPQDQPGSRRRRRPGSAPARPGRAGDHRLIDMDEPKNNRAVEKALKDALARIAPASRWAGSRRSADGNQPAAAADRNPGRHHPRLPALRRGPDACGRWSPAPWPPSAPWNGSL